MDYKTWKEMFDSKWKTEGDLFIDFLLYAGFDINALNKNGTTMLSHAAESGNLEMAKFLVRKGAKAKVANSDGSNPLHVAVQYGRKYIVKFFLERGVSVNSCDKDKCTPLHYIAGKSDIPSVSREGYQELVHILLNHNANLDSVNRKGCTPLLLAAQNSRKHIVELFIKLGANLKSCDENQWTVLHHSSAKGWSGIVRTLVEGRFDIDLDARTSEGCAPVIIAADASHKDIVKLLVKSGANFECKGALDRTVLHYACWKGWFDIVKSLVSKRCDLNAKDSDGNTPLLIAASYSHFSIVKYLIECGADVEGCMENGNTLLHYACEQEQLKVVESLVSKKCYLNSKNSRGETPLLVAASHGSFNIVEYLIECGADVKCCDENGYTLLHYACTVFLHYEHKRLDMVKCLVSKGCDLNAKNYSGDTPLLLAAYFEHHIIVRYFIECGADVEGCNKDGWTLLHYVCKAGWLNFVISVVSKLCDINPKNYIGNTPLYLAASCCYTSVVEYLIEHGADVEDCIIEGVTLMHYACKKGWLTIVKLLTEKGFDVNARDVTNSSESTSLYMAASNLHSSIVEYLIEHGANVEDCIIEGWTLLHYACKQGWSNVVKSLIEKGSDVNARDVYLDTPLHKAVRFPNLEIIEHLLKAGANFSLKNSIGKTAFNIFIQRSVSVEGIMLFLINGAYFQTDDYTALNISSALSKGVLQNTQLCTLALINKFNNADLPKIYKIPMVSKMLPSIEKMKIIDQNQVTQDIEENVKYEIQSKGYCNVLNASPIVLKSLCVLTLVKHYYSSVSVI